MKKRDISHELQRGAEQSDWSASRAGEVLRRVSAFVIGGQIDWDEASGETWGRLLLGNDPAVAVSSLLPVAFVRTPVVAEVLSVLEIAGVRVILTSDWEQREFSADSEIVKQAFGVSEWSAAVDPDGFSASELWWMTV